MRRTSLRGHALRHEGKPFQPASEWDERGPWVRTLRAVGVGLCECGATSPELGTDAARKAWHRQHKDEVRRRAGEQP